MTEMSASKDTRRLFKARYRGRISQIGIYFARQLVLFVYQSDWKTLPMSALIAGLAGMILRNRMFVSMEGTLIGGFAMVMVCIWNGCFNSIQVVCREREVIRREHRLGMHISSYIVSHMLFQALLCLLQAVVTLYVTRAVGLQYPEQGLFTPWMIVDFGISLFIITFAADMMALWISTLTRSAAAAMTALPFVLIFQLVFCGGPIPLPDWTHYVTPLTISSPSLKVVAAQGDYNERPMMVVWDVLNGQRDRELSATVNVGQVLDMLMDKDIPAVKRLHETPLTRVFTLGEVREWLQSDRFQPFKQEQVLKEMSIADVLRFIRDSEAFSKILDYGIDLKIAKLNLRTILDTLLNDKKALEFLESKQAIPTTTVGDILDIINAEGLLDKYRDMQLGKDIDVGDVISLVVNNETVQSFRDQSYTYTTTVGGLVETIGEDRVKDVLQNRIASASYNANYEHTKPNISNNWLTLGLFALAFALLATVTLKLIVRDSR